MNGAKRSVSCLACALCLLFGIAWPGLAINYNDNCSYLWGMGQKWFGCCPDPYFNETNWEGNVLPDPTDHAVIDAQYGAITVDGPASNATVLSVHAYGGLNIDSPSRGLLMTSGQSEINNLYLVLNGKIYAEQGVEVNLTGSPRLGSDVYGPGRYVISGTANLNNCRLWGGATLKNESTANLSGVAGSMLLGHGNTMLNNVGTLTISNGAWINGGGSMVSNEGSISVSSAGFSSGIDPNYIQSGTLDVQSGVLEMRGSKVVFHSGMFDIASGAVVVHSCPFGGPYDFRYAGLPAIHGSGVVRVIEDFTVEDPLEIALGYGTPYSGSGGYYLEHSTLELQANVTNYCRFRFYYGTISGEFPQALWNDITGWVYTTGAGYAQVDAHIHNYGALSIGGAGWTVTDTISNRGAFYIRGGDLGGNGFVANHGFLIMGTLYPGTVSQITVPFDNKGIVRADSGHLEFGANLKNLSQGTLTGGDWKATPPGIIEFPSWVYTVSGARLDGPYSAYVNVAARLFRDGSALKTADWATVGSLLFESDSKATVTPSGQKGTRGSLTVADTLAMNDASSLELRGDVQVTAGQIDNGQFDVGDPSEITSHLSIVPPPTLITPLLNNYARLVPGGHDTTGILHLEGNLVQHDGSTLMIDLAGTTPGNQHDQFTVSGDVTLDGTVAVDAIDGFWPVVGQEFTILTYAGALSGAFDGAESEDPEIAYSLDYRSGEVVLIVDSVVDPLVLEAGISGGQLTLEWNTWPGAAEYWIYGADNLPYFEPGLAPGYEYKLGEVIPPDTTWSTTSGVGDWDHNWTFLVMAVDNVEQELATSNRVGEHDFDVDVPGSFRNPIRTIYETKMKPIIEKLLKRQR